MTNRKFWFMAGAQLAWIILLVAGFLSETSFVSLTNLTCGGYLIANVGQKWMVSTKSSTRE